MELKVKAKRSRETGFYVTVTYMHGDADAFTDETYGPFLTAVACIDFIQIVKSAERNNNVWKSIPTGKGYNIRGGYPYKNLYWLGEECLDGITGEGQHDDEYYDNLYNELSTVPADKPYITPELISNINFYLPYDALCDDYRAQVDNIKCFVVDENGAEYAVEIVYSEEDYDD